LAFYLIITIAVTMTPSSRDLRNIVFSLAALVAIIYFLVKYLGVRIDFNILVRPELLAILSTTAVVLIIMLFLSIILAVTANIIKMK